MTDKNPPIDAIIDAGVVARLITFLQHPNEEIQVRTGSLGREEAADSRFCASSSSSIWRWTTSQKFSKPKSLFGHHLLEN